jgi:uncharacterized protein YbbC (DUF1343 family)
MKLSHKLQRKVTLGCENFLENHLDLVRGKRVGLITNPTGVDSKLQSLIDLFYKNPDIDLVALYGPEHGLRGNAHAGEYVPFYRDEKYNLPVFSLYGQSLEPDPEIQRDLDAHMRTFDTVEEGKFPEKSMIEGVDVLVFDIQDIGTRIYTYEATMAYCMQVCAEYDLEFIVLDRPNPINGKDIEGPILEYPEFRSFVGLYPIPVRHGMTIGELAQFFNKKFLARSAPLTVIPLQGWRRDLWFDQTSLPWIASSPNMPTLQTAIVYPGQVFLEGTNISEGRGTTKPFELLGAPWINGNLLSRNLNQLQLPGVEFREEQFTPTSSKYQEELCGGIHIHVWDRDMFKPFESTLHIIRTIRDMYPDHFQFHAEYFDKITGTKLIRRAIEKGKKIIEIIEGYESQLDEFAKLRETYLLY